MLAPLVYVEPRGRVGRVVGHCGGPHGESGHNQPSAALSAPDELVRLPHAVAPKRALSWDLLGHLTSLLLSWLPEKIQEREKFSYLVYEILYRMCVFMTLLWND